MTMNNQHFLVLFHQVNYSLAATLTRDLVHAGFTFSLVCDDDLAEDETFADRLQSISQPLLLMVSDNFLKTPACVYQLLTALKAKNETSIQIIVLTEGMTQEGQSPVPTRLDRVGQILQYINYWQDKYLNLRKLQADSSSNTTVTETELKWTRKVAFEIGDLIEYFREHNSYSWEAFSANQFELFFRKSGNISLHQTYKDTFPYPDDDHVIEERITEEMAKFTNKDNPLVDATRDDREIPELDGNSLNLNNGSYSPTPEKDLLSKLIAYKNGLEMEEFSESRSTHDEKPASNDRFDDDDFEDNEVDLKPGGEIVLLPTRDAVGLRRILQNDPDNILVRLELATILSQDEAAFNETTGHLEEVLRLDPNNAKAFFLLGQLSQDYKELKLAKRYYEKALENDPEYGQAHFALAQLITEELGVTEAVVDHLNKARKWLPERSDIWLSYGLALAESENPKKAIKVLKKALKLSPENELIKSKLAELYFQTGNRIKAIRYYKEGSSDSLVEDRHEHIASESAQITEELATLIESETPTSPAVVKPATILTVLITGATSGIGRATARLFASKGHRLILTGRREDRLSALQAELEQMYHATIFPITFDIRQEAVARQLIKALPIEWSSIDILINNAGLAKGLAPIQEGKVSDWDTMIDTNIKGLLYITRAVTPGMVERNKGHIINICSTAGKETYPNGNVYCATKFAVDALTKSIRQDLVAYNIRVGQVSPGHVEDTEFALNRFDGDKDRASIYNDFNPLKASDVAEAIYYMINQPPHVNIQDIVLTGTQQASSTLIHRNGRIFD